MKRNFVLISSFMGLATLGIVVSMAATPVPEVRSGTPVPSQPNPADARSLLLEFGRAQRTELRALDHRNRMELKELKTTQGVRLKEWEKKEKEARYKYFAEHATGPERRTYIHEFIKRREAFRKLLTDERTQRMKDHEARLTKVRQQMGVKLKEFKNSVEKGQRPSADLWPKSGN